MISTSVLLPVLFEFLLSSACLSKSSEFNALVSEYVGANPSGGEIRVALGPGPWHWENPRPQGDWLRTVFVLAPNDVWAGGFDTLMHWDGKNWYLTLPMSSQHFSVTKIWASDAQHVWAVRDFDLLQWRGAVWEETGLPSTYWQSIWGTGPNDVWAAGNAGVYHWDGAWARRTPDVWTTGGTGILWGTATDDVTVWHTETLCFNWNGASWQTIQPPPARYLGGNGPGDAWFKKPLDAFLLRFRARVWESHLSPTPYVKPAVWSDQSTEAWALAGVRNGTSFLQFDGKAWSLAQTVPHVLDDISGSAPDHVWAVGDKGAIVRFNGDFEERRAGSIANLNGIFGLSESEVWAVGDSGTVLRRTPTEWESLQVPTQRNLFAISGTSANDLWVVGEGGTSLHFDGKSWSDVPTGTEDDISSVWASGPSDVWAGTRQRPGHRFLHWDGSAWSNWIGVRPQGTLYGFWGSAPDDVWVVGAFCDRYLFPFNPLCIKTASHFDGSAWTVHWVGPAVHSVFERLVAIWGSGSRDVWALAENNASYHWDGEQWSQVEFPEMNNCAGLWGRAQNDVFAACGLSVVHWNGDAWSTLPPLSGQGLTALWGVDSKFWVVGYNGTILRHSATAEE